MGCADSSVIASGRSPSEARRMKPIARRALRMRPRWSASRISSANVAMTNNPFQKGIGWCPLWGAYRESGCGLLRPVRHQVHRLRLVHISREWHIMGSHVHLELIDVPRVQVMRQKVVHQQVTDRLREIYGVSARGVPVQRERSEERRVGHARGAAIVA